MPTIRMLRYRVDHASHRKMHLLRNHNGVVCLTGNGIVQEQEFRAARRLSAVRI